MSTYRAIVVDSHSSPPTLKNLPRPTPTNGEVLVRILAASFLSYTKQILDGTRQYPLSLPFTPGFSAIGRVEEPGPDAVSLTKGQLVYCDIMLRGRDDPDVQMLIGVHGGGYPAAQKLMEGPWRNCSFAELAKFPLENVFALDEEALLKQRGYSVADLSYLGTCLVPYGGLAEMVSAGDTVIVAPATGKFGGAAVTAALAMGTKVIAAGRNETILSAFEKVYGPTGRMETVVLTGDAAKDTQNLRRHSRGGKGVDAYIDFSPPWAGESTHFGAAVGALRRNGRVSLMGGITGTVAVPYSFVMHNNIHLSGRFMYERAHILQAIKMVECGNLLIGQEKAGIESTGYGLDKFGEALEKAAELTKWGKEVVLEP